MNSELAQEIVAPSTTTHGTAISMHRTHYLNVVSTKRSGHHAFISWIQASSPQRTRFFNNTVMKQGTFEKIPSFAENLHEPETIIFNYEGVTPNGVAKAIVQQQRTDAAIKKVLFIRDPLNVCASLLQRQRQFSPELFKIMRQMFALCGFLEIYRQDPSYADLVFYNRWLTDSSYRDCVGQRLMLVPSPIGSKISQFGGGSSFKDLSEGGDAAAPKLLNRWKAYKNDPTFRAIVSTPRFIRTFQDYASGAIAAADGETDFDEERADYLHEISRSRSLNTYKSKLVDGFARDQRFFEKIDSHIPRLYKDAMILNFYLRAVLPVSSQVGTAN